MPQVPSRHVPQWNHNGPQLVLTQLATLMYPTTVFSASPFEFLPVINHPLLNSVYCFQEFNFDPRKMERTLIPYFSSYLQASVINYIGHELTSITVINLWLLLEYWIEKMSVHIHNQEGISRLFTSYNWNFSKLHLNHQLIELLLHKLESLHPKQTIQIMRTKYQNLNEVFTDLDYNIPNFKIRTVVDANIAAKSLS